MDVKGGSRMVEQTIAPVKKSNGTLRRWEPFDMFETLQQEMERFWHRPFSFPFGSLPAFSQLPTKAGMTYTPRTDVFEKDDTLVFKAELPGLKKEDVRVEIYNGNLVIKGESKAEREVKEEAYYRVERSFGSFYRSLPLPFDVTPEQMKATLTDGVLEVQIPKPAEAKPTATKIPVG
jgi:HSP20 family protein